MGKGRRVKKHRQKITSRILRAHIPWSQRGILFGLLLSVGIAWIFYDSFLGMAFAILLIPGVCILVEQKRKKDQIEQDQMALKELLLLISSYMQAGYSIENAFFEAEKEIAGLFANSRLPHFLHMQNEKIRMSVPVEAAFYEMAEQLDLEEAYEFADVLIYAKRLGGNYIANMQKAAVKLEDKLSVQEEITTIMTEKQLELRVMSVMPLGILAYIKVTSESFISVLYHNAMGVFIMSGCILLYGVMLWLGRKIINIQV